MTDPKTTLIHELRRRQVFKTAGIYAGSAWLATEILLAVIEQLPLGEGLHQFIRVALIVVFVSAFPPAILLAWYWDWFRGGIKREQQWRGASRASVIIACGMLVAGTGALLAVLLWVAGIGRPLTSVAVYPCRYFGDSEHAYHASAVAREIHYQLSNLDTLRLIAWSKSNSADGHGDDTEPGATAEFQIDCRLNLDEQSAQLNLRLYDTASDTDVWATQIKTTTNSIFVLPGRAIESLSEQFLPDNAIEIIQRRVGPLTPVANAWDSYARALILVDSGNVIDLKAALELMDAAAKHDDQFARAYVWMAKLHWELASDYQRFGITDAERRARVAAAESNAQKALILQPDYRDALAIQQALAESVEPE